MTRPKTLLFGVMALTIGALAMKVISQPAPAPTTVPTTNPVNSIGSMTPLRGVDVSVRETGETAFTEKTRKLAVEAYRDEDFGTLTYVSGTGAIAAVPQPANFELRHLPFDRYYETIRFSPLIGAAWRLNLRTGKWQGIEDAGQLLPGNYDVDVFTISETSMVVMRIDKLTGRTWTMVSAEGKADRWEPITEPEEVKPAK